MSGERTEEPMKLEIVGSEARLKGYPDTVKVIRVTGVNCRKLSDLALHNLDLSFALESLDFVNEQSTALHVRESLWRSAIVHCFKCFQHSESRGLLNAKVVFASSPPEVMDNFRLFKSLRNKHLVHDENSYIQCDIGAILNNGKKSNKIEKVFPATLLMLTLTQEHVAQFQSIVLNAHAYVQREIDSLIEVVKGELEAKTYDQLLAMPQLVQTSPTPDAAGRKR